MKKRRQHYVWQHYLEAWTLNGKLWCSTRGRCFRASTENVANERDFYRLREMSERDLQWVEMLVIRQAAEPLADLARGWVPHFREFHRLKRVYEGSGQRNAELEQALDESINDLEEDLHGRIETRAVPVLAKLRKRDISFVNDDEEIISFCWFVASQYLRTPRMAKDVVGAASEIPGFNAEAAWGLMRTIFAANLGYGFYVRRPTISFNFLEAPDGAEFATGDQPIINLAAGDLPNGVPPEVVDLYYPLTPMLAVVVGFDATEPSKTVRSLTAAETRRYNAKIVEAAHEQVYARTEVALPKPREGQVKVR